MFISPSRPGSELSADSIYDARSSLYENAKSLSLCDHISCRCVREVLSNDGVK